MYFRDITKNNKIKTTNYCGIAFVPFYDSKETHHLS